MKSEEYDYHRIAIRKGSLAQKGLAKEVARRVGVRHEASILSQFIDDLYREYAEEGKEDIDLLTLVTRLSVPGECKEKKEKIDRRQPPDVADPEDYANLDKNLDDFLG